MTTTENHELNRPAMGADDWGVQLNENFAALEAAVTLVGAHAEVDPSVDPDIDTVQHTPHTNALFYAFDSGAVFRGDGTAWNHVGTVGKRKEYTASGDGTQTTFTVSHSLPTPPVSVQVEATSPDAAANQWYVTNKTASSFDIEYVTAPPAGTDNLTFNISMEV